MSIISGCELSERGTSFTLANAEQTIQTHTYIYTSRFQVLQNQSLSKLRAECYCTNQDFNTQNVFFIIYGWRCRLVCTALLNTNTKMDGLKIILHC